MKLLSAFLLFITYAVISFAGSIPTGAWRLTRYVDMTETSTSPADINNNLGKEFRINGSNIKFRRKHCNIEDQQVLATEDAANEFFLANKSFYSELHINAPVTIINTSCNMLIVGSHGEVFVEWEGNVYATQKEN
jgi:hypothetical protein